MPAAARKEWGDGRIFQPQIPSFFTIDVIDPLIGPTGPAGPTGPQGIQGEVGPAGPSGPMGPEGLEGPQGDPGPSGPSGPTGPQGVQGPQGISGATGATGPEGEQGLTGPTGPSGATGPEGPEGPQGESGPSGVSGETGPTGASGSQGIQGPIGPSGPQGEQGSQGPQGDQGPIGPTGPQGITGPEGPQGPGGPPPLLGFSITALANPGADTCVTIAADGLPLVSYANAATGWVRILHCNDVACTSSEPQDIAEGTAASITTGSDGFGIISYQGADTRLKVAHCQNEACVSPALSSLETTSATGQSNSIAIGRDGLPLIAYWDRSIGGLKVAHCNDTSCGSATTTVLDAGGGNTGLGVDLTVGTDGLGIISYWGSGGLKVAHCGNLVCSTAGGFTNPDGASTLRQSQIAIGQDGLALIAYSRNSGNLRMVHCNNTECTSASASTLSNDGNNGDEHDLAIGTDGLAVISFWQTSPVRVLKMAHCSDVPCTTARPVTVDLEGMGTSITVGTDGLPLITYRNSESQVRALHCSNRFCIPYHRAPR
jgi:hypothetical protein